MQGKFIAWRKYFSITQQEDLAQLGVDMRIR